MADLFRYVEHAFAIPQATPVVDVANQSHFQSSLRDAASQEGYAGVRRVAGAFLDSTFPSPTDDPLAGTAGYQRFRTALDVLVAVDRAAITELVSEVFDAGTPFRTDPLESLVAVSRAIGQFEVFAGAADDGALMRTWRS